MPTMDSNTVPAFITKLWRLVEDTNCDHLIRWNKNGQSFIILDQSKFAKELLPLYFKHSNMASFIRQLNMYGFRKVANIENSGLRSERDDIEFYHQFFAKAKESQLESIKRKISLKISPEKAGSAVNQLKQEEVSDILHDVESLKGKQESVDNMLTSMQRENEALWREVAILRQKHHKQQKLVEKLIQFLVSLVQNRNILGMKRKAHLMIDDTEENRQKMLKQNDFSSMNPRSNGPIIHDITDDDLEETIAGAITHEQPIIIQKMTSLATNSSADQLLLDSKPIQTTTILDPLQQSIEELGLIPEPSEQPIDVSDANLTTDVDSLLRSTLNTPPGSPSLIGTVSESKQNDGSNEKPNNVKDLVLSTPTCDQMISSLTSSSLTEHVDGIEAELDWLQDQLCAGINIDSSTLLGLLTTDDSNQSQSNYFMPSTNQFPSHSIVGNEVIQFNPNTNALFDELDFDSIDANNDIEEPLLDESLLGQLDTEGAVSFPPEKPISVKAFK